MNLVELLDDLGLAVPPEAVSKLGLLVDELLRWNRRRNLTAITDRAEILEKHLVDSLTLLDFANSSERLLDIGSGAGFPALPLKIACPGLRVVSVDAVGKKVDFQRHIVRAFKLTGFTAVHERIENLADNPEYCQSFDLVTARALCPLAELIAMADPFLTSGGRIVAMKGPEGVEELSVLEKTVDESAWVIKSHHFTLPSSRAVRYLIELRKT